MRGSTDLASSSQMRQASAPPWIGAEATQRREQPQFSNDTLMTGNDDVIQRPYLPMILSVSISRLVSVLSACSALDSRSDDLTSRSPPRHCLCKLQHAHLPTTPQHVCPPSTPALDWPGRGKSATGRANPACLSKARLRRSAQPVFALCCSDAMAGRVRQVSAWPVPLDAGSHPCTVRHPCS